jgi:hypothetical protein
VGDQVSNQDQRTHTDNVLQVIGNRKLARKLKRWLQDEEASATTTKQRRPGRATPTVRPQVRN